MGYSLLVSLAIKEKLLTTNRKKLEKIKTNSRKRTKQSIQHDTKHRLSYLSYLYLAVLVVLSLKTINRCFEWNHERTLFESALKVCPYSLKVMNNLALLLLNTKDNHKAGILLDDALTMFPGFKNAIFNRGKNLDILSLNLDLSHSNGSLFKGLYTILRMSTKTLYHIYKKILNTIQMTSRL